MLKWSRSEDGAALEAGPLVALPATILPAQRVVQHPRPQVAIAVRLEGRQGYVPKGAPQPWPTARSGLARTGLVVLFVVHGGLLDKGSRKDIRSGLRASAGVDYTGAVEL